MRIQEELLHKCWWTVSLGQASWLCSFRLIFLSYSKVSLHQRALHAICHLAPYQASPSWLILPRRMVSWPGILSMQDVELLQTYSRSQATQNITELPANGVQSSCAACSPLAVDTWQQWKQRIASKGTGSSDYDDSRSKWSSSCNNKCYSCSTRSRW